MPKAARKKAPAAKAAPYPVAGKKVTNPLFEAHKKSFSIGGDLPPRKRDLGRFVKFPKYIQLQRQRAVLYKRLKVPPAVNQFCNTADRNLAQNVLQLLCKYRPETSVEKTQRLKNLAAQKVAGKKVLPTRAATIKMGLNHVTSLIETKKASLVVIAHDVDPIELVVWLPALCRRMDVPYVIIKGKARLGTLVHKKTAACLALTKVRPEDERDLAALLTAVKTNFLPKVDATKNVWGGGIMGIKSVQKKEKRQRALAREAFNRLQA